MKCFWFKHQPASSGFVSVKMNATSIDFMLKTDPNTKYLWKGFLAPDVPLPKKRKKKKTTVKTRRKQTDAFQGIYILNTGPSFTKGEHWCCLIMHDTFCEFFDSYGEHPISYNLLDSLNPGCIKIVFNKKKVQGSTAQTCGHHCVYYARERAKKQSMLSIMNKYSSHDFNKNDCMVYTYVRKNFGSKFAEIQEY